MAYQRFELRMYPAKVANSAKADVPEEETLAELSSLAGHASAIQDRQRKTLARLAILAEGRAENARPGSATLSIEIAIELERAVARLRMRGYSRDEVQRLARAIVTADLRNSEVLFVRQTTPDRCHVCGERETSDKPFIAVLSAKPGHPHWLHLGCWPEHVRRIDAAVEEVMEWSVPF